MNEHNVLVLDVDGTICSIKDSEQEYSEVAPEPKLVAKIRELKRAGWRIVLQTARGMRTYQGSVGDINAHVLPTLIEWLKTHNVPYDEIHIGKPWPGQNGVYVDDRSVRPREFLENSMAELESICARDRIA